MFNVIKYSKNLIIIIIIIFIINIINIFTSYSTKTTLAESEWKFSLQFIEFDELTAKVC